MLTQDELLMVLAGALFVLGIVALVLFIRGDRSRGRRRCPKCWYDLSATAGMLCPECGKVQKREKRFFRARRRKRVAVLGVVLLVGGYVSYMTPKVRRNGVYRYLPTWGLICLAPARVPESPYDGVYITFDDRFSGAFSGGSIFPPKSTPITELKVRGSERGDLNSFERWLWVTRDRLAGPDEGEFRFIVDLKELWEPHAIDLQRLNADRLVTKGDFTWLIDEFLGYGPNEFFDRYSTQVRGDFTSVGGDGWGNGWGNWYLDESSGAPAGLVAATRVYGHASAVEMYTFGSHLVISGPRELEPFIRFRMLIYANPLDQSEVGLPLRDFEIPWYPTKKQVNELVDIYKKENRFSLYGAPSLPSVMRVYSFADEIMALPPERLKQFRESPYLLEYAFQNAWFSSVKLGEEESDQEEYWATLDQICSADTIGTSLVICGPLEYHAGIVNLVLKGLRGELEKDVWYTIYKDGRVEPYSDNK